MSLLLATVLLVAEPPAGEATTEHYHVWSQGLEAEEAGQMLEQLHAELTRFFGRPPHERPLEVEIHADAERFRQAIQEDGQTYVGGGGYYAPGNKKVYTYPQPSDYFSRSLILHEATHQFHFLAATGNRQPAADWYTEGLAEYYGSHNWDGETLRVGVVPLVSLEDYPAKALKQFDDLGHDLEGIVAGRVDVERPLCWGLVHFLRSRYPRRFAAVSLALDGDTDPLTAWRQVFGPVSPELVLEFRNYLIDHQQQWQEVWQSWQQVGERLEGRSDATAVILLKRLPKELEADMELVDGELKAGVTFDYRHEEDYRLLQVLEGDNAWITRRYKGKWIGPERFKIPSAGDDGLYRIKIRQFDDTATLWVNGRELKTVDSDGRIGLNVDACCARFQVRWTPKPGTEPDYTSPLPIYLSVPRWLPVWRHWWQSGNTLQGQSDTTGIVLFRETPEALKVELEPVDGTLRAGLTFGYRSPEEFSMIQVFDNRRAWLVERANDKWKTPVAYDIAKKQGARHIVSLRRTEGKVTMAVNGREVKTVETSGRIGLNVDGCRVKFRFLPVGNTP